MSQGGVKRCGKMGIRFRENKAGYFWTKVVGVEVLIPVEDDTPHHQDMIAYF